MKKIFAIIALIIFSEQLFAQAASQLPPVKGIGIVVKKNPGSGASMVLNPTPEGRLAFSLTEAGDYTVNVQDLNVANQGGPIKGVKVSLGKNPPGAIIARGVSNDSGEVEFKNLTLGDYTIELTESGKTGLIPIQDIGTKRAKPLQKVSDIPYKQFNKQ